MKKTITREGAGDRESYSNKLVYLHLVTGLVYRSSPPKNHGLFNFLAKTLKNTCE